MGGRLAVVASHSSWSLPRPVRPVWNTGCNRTNEMVVHMAMLLCFNLDFNSALDT